MPLSSSGKTNNPSETIKISKFHCLISKTGNLREFSLPSPPKKYVNDNVEYKLEFKRFFIDVGHILSFTISSKENNHVKPFLFVPQTPYTRVLKAIVLAGEYFIIFSSV